MTFCTLTYGATFPTAREVYKADLNRYRVYFERKWGKLPVIWRLEFQERGAPHYHLMYLDAPFIPIVEWNDLWDKASRRPEGERFGNSVHIELVADADQERLIAFYMGKYMAKLDTRLLEAVGGSTGRFWGKWNIKQEPMTEITMFDYEAKELIARLLAEREYQNWQPGDPLRCTLFGEHLGTDHFERRVIHLAREIAENARRRGFEPRKKIT